MDNFEKLLTTGALVKLSIIHVKQKSIQMKVSDHSYKSTKCTKLPIGHSLNENRSGLVDADFPSSLGGVVHGKHVITVHSNGGHSISTGSGCCGGTTHENKHVHNSTHQTCQYRPLRLWPFHIHWLWML